MIGGTPFLIWKGMYNRKEKLEHFNHLAGAQYGAVDLELLTDECPSHKDLSKFARDPKRYANEILYALLDVCTVEDIQENRSYYEHMMQDADALGAQAVAAQSAAEAGEHEAAEVTEEHEAAEAVEEVGNGSSETLRGNDKDKDDESSTNIEQEDKTDNGSSETLTKEEQKSEEGQESVSSDAPPEDAKKK